MNSKCPVSDLYLHHLYPADYRTVDAGLRQESDDEDDEEEEDDDRDEDEDDGEDDDENNGNDGYSE